MRTRRGKDEKKSRKVNKEKQLTDRTQVQGSKEKGRKAGSEGSGGSEREAKEGGMEATKRRKEGRKEEAKDSTEVRYRSKEEKKTKQGTLHCSRGGAPLLQSLYRSKDTQGKIRIRDHILQALLRETSKSLAVDEPPLFLFEESPIVLATQPLVDSLKGPAVDWAC
jgi:hypothetical protein